MARPNRLGGTATVLKGKPFSCGGKMKAKGGKISTKKKSKKCC